MLVFELEEPLSAAQPHYPRRRLTKKLAERDIGGSPENGELDTLHTRYGFCWSRFPNKRAPAGLS
jgi:hypothetical protein